MEFIISKGTTLPKDQLEMESSDWFNMWEKRNFPYQELLTGDILYWLDTIEKRLIWKTEVIKVERRPYADKNEIYKLYKDSMTKQYYESRPEFGYFLHYEIKVLEKMDIPKPNYKFSQLGWERMDSENFKRWFDQISFEDSTTLDYSIDSNEKSIIEKLIALNQKMQYVSPTRIKKLVLTTIRKDTKFINILKEAAGFKCQYPNCGHQIKTKSGNFYIEVAHIDPVANDGQSVLGNLLVLCPNHHKEFDYGDLIINERERTFSKLSGTLNGIEFTIRQAFIEK